MYEGQPLSLSMFLPHSLRQDDTFVVLAGAAALFCLWAVYNSFSVKDKFSHKIKAIQERRNAMRDEFVGKKKRKKPEIHTNIIRTISTKLQLVKKNQIGKTEAELIQAGLRSKDAIYVLAFFNLILPIILAIIGIVIMNLNSDVSPKWKMMNYIWPVLGAYIGLKLPWWYVHRTKKKRNHAIRKALPDVLDLMTICAEAGLSMVASLDRVARELKISYPEMAEELSITSIEIGFLPDRNKAFLNLAGRVDMPEVRGIVSVLIQTEKYGTPIAQALRVLSAEFRQERMLRAEQKAAKLPALMTVPMIVFILPTLFIVIIAPAAVKLMNTIN